MLREVAEPAPEAKDERRIPKSKTHPGSLCRSNDRLAETCCDAGDGQEVVFQFVEIEQKQNARAEDIKAAPEIELLTAHNAPIIQQ